MKKQITFLFVIAASIFSGPLSAQTVPTGDDFPAFNTITAPSINISASGGAFEPGLLVINDATGFSKFDLGNSEETSWIWVNFGHNNIEVTSSPTSPVMPLIQSEFGTVNIGSVDNNFWKNVSLSEVLDPHLGTTNWTSGPNPGEFDAFGITFTSTSGAAGTIPNVITDFWHDGVMCGSGTSFGAKKDKGSKSLSVDSLPTGCQLIYNEAHSYDNNQLWQMCYDTAKKLVEQCTLYYPDVVSAFRFMTDAVTALGNTGKRQSDYYAWLKSVLYLNTTNPEYFCQCVEALAGEIPIPYHIYPDTGYDWGLSIYNWLIKNTSCDTPGLSGLFYGTRETQIQTWQNDPSQYKLDTTLPPLDSIEPGLQELLEKHLLYADVPENFHGILSNASANPNPTGNGTVISFGISKEAYVKIELFDVLGHEVSSYGYESLFEPGNKSVPLSLMGLPSGTYYARIMSAYGEVQTVKLIKE